MGALHATLTGRPHIIAVVASQTRRFPYKIAAQAVLRCFRSGKTGAVSESTRMLLFLIMLCVQCLVAVSLASTLLPGSASDPVGCYRIVAAPLTRLVATIEVW